MTTINELIEDCSNAIKELGKDNSPEAIGKAHIKILNALTKAENLPISDVVGQSEQLVCPNCKSPHITDRIFKKECLMCGQKFKAN